MYIYIGNDINDYFNCYYFKGETIRVDGGWTSLLNHLPKGLILFNLIQFL